MAYRADLSLIGCAATPYSRATAQIISRCARMKGDAELARRLNVERNHQTQVEMLAGGLIGAAKSTLFQLDYALDNGYTPERYWAETHIRDAENLAKEAVEVADKFRAFCPDPIPRRSRA